MKLEEQHLPHKRQMLQLPHSSPVADMMSHTPPAVIMTTTFGPGSFEVSSAKKRRKTPVTTTQFP
jgi:hypothetical protein